MSNEFSIQYNDTKLYVGGEIADENWQPKYVSMVPTPLQNKWIYTYDLVSNGYLPNDNYDYEILLSSFVWTTSAAGNIVGLWLYSVQPDLALTNYTTYSNITPFNFRTRLIRARTRVANYHSCQGSSCTFPIINGGKKLVFWNSDTVTMHYWNFELHGYRRLGINT